MTIVCTPARRGSVPGVIRSTKTIDKPAVQRLKSHIARQKAAVKGTDVAARSFLLGDFHVCLAECLGNSLLAGTLRDFTARTTLIAMRYQSPEDAAQSCAEHVEIVAALEAGELKRAEQLMAAHLSTWQRKLHVPGEDPLHKLRTALAPLGPKAQELHTRKRSTYLGEVL